MPIGPALPPHLAHLSGSGGGEDDEESRGNANGSDPNVPRARSSSPDEDDYGPALPPHLAAVRKGTVTAGPSRPALPLSPRRPVIDDDGDDDLIGPMPVASVGKEKSAVQEFMEREERKAKEREDAAKPKKMQREEWMLVPPTSGVLASVDPLRKRPTTFSRSAAPVDTDNTVWTETPVEKAQRIADEVAGIKRKRLPKVGDGPDEEELAARRARDRQIRDGVEQHSKESRGKSLLEQHSTKPKKDEEPAAIWDHDRDMGISGRLLTDRERQAKIKEARGLNDRFGHSKRGAYDM